MGEIIGKVISRSVLAISIQEKLKEFILKNEEMFKGIAIFDEDGVPIFGEGMMVD